MVFEEYLHVFIDVFSGVLVCDSVMFDTYLHYFQRTILLPSLWWNMVELISKKPFSPTQRTEILISDEDRY